MSGEIVVPETPNWLNDLEAKREKRLKARLGHEAGAGAPCLKCEDKCPGLDLHFWRKSCKACRCPKEDHDVPDDDIYGWAQFQLLGSKPNKIKTKIVLPGKKDEVELDWTPKGQKDTIDKYLKTLPPEALPVKGSQAAQDRKQLLQKQIPVHDIDPSLCHELNEEEVTKMEEYIAHIKKSSVGVGQIVNLSSVIKANLHNISPQEAHIIASRYAKGIPFSEIVKLQYGLAQDLEKLALNNAKSNKNPSVLPSMQPSKLRGAIPEEKVPNTLPATKFKDITHPWYTQSSPGKGTQNPQYSKPVGDNSSYALNEKWLQGTNFDPSKTPSQFLGYHTPGYRVEQYPQDIDSTRLVKGEIIKATKKTPGPVQACPGLTANISQNLQYGFENPYFNQNRQDPKYAVAPSEQTQDSRAPKSVKDLMYSTYDPSNGPVLQNQDDNVQVPGYEPNMLFNTYKNDPLLETENYGLQTSDPKLGLRKYDPITGKYVFKHPSPPELPKFDPVSGKYIQEEQVFPETSNQYRKTLFDPSTGRYIIEEPNSLDAKEGRHFTPSKTRKPLSALEPEHINIPEDYLEPHLVNVGAIQDINPEIRAATTELNPGFDKDNSPDYSPESIREILNNVKFPDCHYCKKPFDENEFAVTIDRANVLFHAQCFKCAGCNQSLADNIYFYHKESNNVYCGRDYAKIKGYPRCSACDELIFTKEYCLAENATFHLKHFCCFQCDTPLAGQDYTLEDEKPYCLPCYETSKAAKCSTCEKVIKPDEIGCKLNGVHFHAENRCFRCIVCSVPLMGKKLLLRNEKLYCSHDCFNTGKK